MCLRSQEGAIKGYNKKAARNIRHKVEQRTESKGRRKETEMVKLCYDDVRLNCDVFFFVVVVAVAVVGA